MARSLLQIIKEATSPATHKAEYHRHMDEYEGWNHEGLQSHEHDYEHQDHCFAMADHHLEMANQHAQKHFELTGTKIRQKDKVLLKKSNPAHVSEATDNPIKKYNTGKTVTHAELATHYDDEVERLRGMSATAAAKRFPGASTQNAIRAHNMQLKQLKAKADHHRYLSSQNEEYMEEGKDKVVHHEITLGAPGWRGHKLVRVSSGLSVGGDKYHLRSPNGLTYHQDNKPIKQTLKAWTKTLGIKRGVSESLDETLRMYKPKQVKRTAEELYHHHMGKHYHFWDRADATEHPEGAQRLYNKALDHADKAEDYAAEHFRKTGKKIKDTGYTGNSPHVEG